MYFEKDFHFFLNELALNNNREWFHENKKRYEKSVKVPFKSFVQALINQVKDNYDPGLELEAKNATFRIARDIRFSKDKTPYNVHVSAIVSREGRKDMILPGMFFRFDAEKVLIGGGCYMPPKEELYAIRESIIAKPKEFQKALNDDKFRSIYKDGIIGEKNKVIPKEFRDAAQDEPLIFNKQFYFMTQYSPDTIFRKDLMEFMLKHYKAGEIWNAWCREAMGN